MSSRIVLTIASGWPAGSGSPQSSTGAFTTGHSPSAQPIVITRIAPSARPAVENPLSTQTDTLVFDEHPEQVELPRRHLDFASFDLGSSCAGVQPQPADLDYSFRAPDDTFPHQGTQLGTHQRGEAAWRKPGIGSDGQARRGHVFVRSDNQYRCRGRPADFRRHVDEVATIQEYGICGWLAKQSACLSMPHDINVFGRKDAFQVRGHSCRRPDHHDSGAAGISTWRRSIPPRGRWRGRPPARKCWWLGPQYVRGCA